MVAPPGGPGGRPFDMRTGDGGARPLLLQPHRGMEGGEMMLRPGMGVRGGPGGAGPGAGPGGPGLAGQYPPGQGPTGGDRLAGAGTGWGGRHPSGLLPQEGGLLAEGSWTATEEAIVCRIGSGSGGRGAAGPVRRGRPSLFLGPKRLHAGGEGQGEGEGEGAGEGEGEAG